MMVTMPMRLYIKLFFSVLLALACMSENSVITMMSSNANATEQDTWDERLDNDLDDEDQDESDELEEDDDEDDDDDDDDDDDGYDD